jgi:hypothetical protein
MGIGGMGVLGSLSLWFILVLVWSLFWKGFALWYAAKRHEQWWFIALLVINTMGILEIVYIFFVAKVPEFRKKLGLS